MDGWRRFLRGDTVAVGDIVIFFDGDTPMKIVSIEPDDVVTCKSVNSDRTFSIKASHIWRVKNAHDFTA